MEVKIQTLTPLWTGGVDGSMDRIHETGIIGSLRWWYEAIVRGLGGCACDPSQNDCIFDAEKYRKSTATDERQRLREAGLCDVCQVFGATGWRRRFRVVMVDKSKQIFQGNNMLVPSGHVHNTRDGKRAGGWYIGPGRITQADSAIRGTIPKLTLFIPSFEQQIIPTLALIEHWGSLGAKNQLGYGIVGFHERVKNEWQPLQATVQSPISQKNYRGHLPALTNFFFAKIRFNPKDETWWKKFSEIKIALQGQVNGVKLANPITEVVAKEWLAVGAFPIAPIIRNWLRFTLFSDQTPNVLNFFLGTTKQVCQKCYGNVKPDSRNMRNRWCGNCYKSMSVGQVDERVASKVKISSAYKIPHSNCWGFRFWGWLPQQAPDNLSIDRDKLLKTLYDAIKPNGILWSEQLEHLVPCNNAFEWHEFGAPTRDARHYGDSAEFLNFLLRGSKL